MVIRRCKHVSALGIFLSVFLAVLGLTFLSNTLALRSLEDPVWIYFWNTIGFDLYFLVAFFSGLGFINGMHPRVIRYRSLVMALMIVPGVVVLFTLSYVYIIPLARGLLAVMPLVGLSLAIKSLAEWPFSSAAQETLVRLRKLVKVQVAWCLVIAGLFELGVLYQRWLAAAVIYPGLVLLGILFTVEARWVREDVETAMRAPTAQRTDQIAPLKMVETDFRPGLPHPGTGMSRQQRTILAFFILAMVPCIGLLACPARLDITYATAGGQNSGLIIVNRGGQAAEDVELWGDGVLITKIERIDGFGVWEVRAFRFPSQLVIMVGGKNVASGTVYYPPTTCDVIWLALSIIAVGTVMPAILKKR
jgi:hypothetical protein